MLSRRAPTIALRRSRSDDRDPTTPVGGSAAASHPVALGRADAVLEVVYLRDDVVAVLGRLGGVPPRAIETVI